jgi:replication factor C subunit 1
LNLILVVSQAADASVFFGGSPTVISKPTSGKSPAASLKGDSVSSELKFESKKVKLETAAIGASPLKRAKTVSAPAASLAATTSSGPKLALEDLKVVVTGVMASGVSREQIEDLVLTHGGKISKSVSGKTNLLVVGSVLEDGRAICEGRKHCDAVEKGVRIVTEEVFLEMIAAGTVRRDAALAAQRAQTYSAPAQNSFVRQPSTQPVYSQSSSSSSSSAAASKKSSSVDGLLWVDKHQPQNTSELVGSGELVKKMSDWLRRWDAVHLTKTLKVPFSKDNPGAKAILLSGPPGIGKTTVATLIAREFNYDVLELNASDTRNKKDVGDHLSDAVLSRAIAADGSTSLRRRLVVMDEVDGMGGSDRGGVAELIRIIKLSKTPIVCICNDRMSTKIRSLANHCFDLKVKRPTKQQIAARLVSIAQKEGMTVDTNAAEMLVEQVGNDIRQAVNSMQMWRASSDRMQYADMKDSMHRIEKDKVLRQTSFDACMQILGGARSGSLEDRYNSFFIDYSLVPLLIQQNYVDSAKSGVFKAPNLDEGDKMEALSRAADAVSDVDLAGACIMGQDQHWELLPAQAAFSARVGSIIQGFQAFPSFPAVSSRVMSIVYR